MSSPLRITPITTAPERAAWDDLAARSPVGHRHQCLWWMEPLERYGFRSCALGAWLEGRLVGGGLFRSYPAPLLRTTVSECLDGPIFLEWERGWADTLVGALDAMGRRAHSVAVIIKDCPREDVHRDVLAAFRGRGLHTQLRPGAPDAVLALEGRTLEQVRSGFNHGTRQRIRKGSRVPLGVRRLTRPDELEQAYAAWLATAARKQFADIRPWPGLEPVLRHCIDHDLGSVFGSFLDGKLLAAAFVTHAGRTAAWVYGGYHDGAEKYNPTHLLQYEAIRESLERGIDAYNFGNLLGESRPEARGVDEFKLGFGAEPRRHLDTIVWKRRPVLYASLDAVRRSRLGKFLEGRMRRRMMRPTAS